MCSGGHPSSASQASNSAKLSAVKGSDPMSCKFGGINSAGVTRTYREVYRAFDVIIEWNCAQWSGRARHRGHKCDLSRNFSEYGPIQGRRQRYRQLSIDLLPAEEAPPRGRLWRIQVLRIRAGRRFLTL